MKLECLDDKANGLVAAIVDCYVKGNQQIADGSNPYIDNAGVTVDSTFFDYDGENVCNTIFHKSEDDNVKVHYVFPSKCIKLLPNEDESKAFFRYINIKRSEVVYKITMLKWLHDGGFIFLLDDKRWNLFNTGKITEHDIERWAENGIRHYSEELKSNAIYEVISQFHNCRIIPSPQLIDYRNNGFLTSEQRRFKKTCIISWAAIGISLAIGIVSLWASRSWPHEIEQQQIDTIINAIPKSIEEIKLNQEQMDSIISILNKNNQPNNGKTKNANGGRR